MEEILFGKLAELGLGVVALVILYLIVKMFVEMWGRSTDAINRNTNGFEQLSEVLAKSHERDIQFQKDAMKLMRDTHDKVDEIHVKIIKGG